MAKTQGSVHVVRGEDKTIPLSIRHQNGKPLDLTLCTAVIATFRTKNQGVASVTLTGDKVQIITPPGAGVVHINLDNAFTTNMADGDRQDFQVDIVLDGKRMAFRFEESMNVAESMSAV